MLRHKVMKKEKLDFKALKKIFGYAKKYFPLMIISIICATVCAVTTIIGPDKISSLMNILLDGIFTGVDMKAFLEIAILLVCLYSGGAVFSYIQQFVTAIVTQKFSKKIRTDINEKINKLPLSYFDKTTKGDVISRVTNDVDTISQTLGSSVANLISAFVLFVGVTVKMFETNWLLSLITIGTSLFGFVFMGIILGNSQKFFNKRQEYLGDVNGHIEEVYSGLNVIKSYNAVDNEQQVFDNNNTKLYKTEWKSQFLSGLMSPIMAFVGNLSYLLIFAVGVAIILNGGNTVTIGTLVAFIIYSKLFSQPLRTFAQSLSSLQQTSAASKRVFEILDSEEMENEQHKTKQLESIKGDVEFKNVVFGYEKDKTIIKNFSAKFNAGQKIAIVGPTGAGKTTLVN
ncbi:MAG: ABC transporter ATP-binding protein, partial [Clostridia bacterium]|nr:ABC transporter ATP-binding protein [Clostridia bacterium]